MYIEPSTNIRLLHNVPLDTSYDHTIYFANETAQYDYFVSLQKYNLTNYTYQRVKRGVARVGIVAENLYDCNYMMFRNINFGSKWFYAFITGVEYVNNEMSEIYFELDVMQTWHFNYEMEQCFVEREHTSTDAIGEHTISEGIDVGDYFYEYIGRPNVFTGLYKIVVCTTFDAQFDQSGNVISISDDAEGNLYGNMYSGLKYHIFSADALTSVNSFLQKVTEEHNESGVISIFMVPNVFTTGDQTHPATWEHTVNKNYSSLGSYTPRNNKLFCYPYNMLHMIDNNGNCADFHFEYFGGNVCGFQLAGTMVGQPEAQICPLSYKGVTKNENEKMIVTDFPQCAFTIDSYRAWLAQNKYGIWATGAGIGVGMATATMVGGPAGGVVAGLNSLGTVFNLMAQRQEAYTLPPHARGKTTGALNTAMRQQGFTFYYAYVRPEYARIIDNFFDRFGYACRRDKIPNRNVRPHWTYTKTIACTVKGSIPSDDMRKICSIYDNGITFWRHGSEVGNYSLDNSPA